MRTIFNLFFLGILSGCANNQISKSMDSDTPIQLITLDPGHFHAALVQKSMYPGISPEVYVYAPDGPELKAHQNLIQTYNTRKDSPTQWKQIVYTGKDFFEKMSGDKKGNLVVLAGNNRNKTEYINKSVSSGFHVLSDKPMAINSDNFQLLEQAFATASANGVLLYDIMTERFEITSIIQRRISQIEEIFGRLENGDPDNPAIQKESVHHFYKQVSGAQLVRPAWYFDVEQQGEGIADVTTHMIDLIQWQCFPGLAIDYKKDIRILHARRWPTVLSLNDYRQVTRWDSFPSYLRKNIAGDELEVYANGEISYTIKNVHARISVKWNYEAPEGTGDTHYSIMRGSKANLVIRQGAATNYKPVLYIEPVDNHSLKKDFLEKSIKPILNDYPGIEMKQTAAGYELVIPQIYRSGHESHFEQVMRNFIKYIQQGSLPEWEVPNMLAKYYTTTEALKLALENQ